MSLTDSHAGLDENVLELRQPLMKKRFKTPPEPFKGLICNHRKCLRLLWQKKKKINQL